MNPARHTKAQADLDAELVLRYGGSVPRYTSYPTALQFTTKFGVPALHPAWCLSR